MRSLCFSSLLDKVDGEDPPRLFGFSAYVQGLMVDATGAFGVTYGLTGAFELLVGP